MPVVIRNPYAHSGQYHKAQLHCHTTASDGQFAPEELLRMYQAVGYSFVCITDHNRVTRCELLNGAQFLAVPGTEDTVSRVLRPLGPHMGRLFVDRALRTGSPQDRIDHTRATGGLISCCHPSWTGNLWTGGWSAQTLARLRGFHLIEIWNPHSRSAEDIQRWAAALRVQGPETCSWGVAVDDCHHRGQFNCGWIMVKVSEVSAAAFRQALLAGAFYASTGPWVEVAVSGTRIEVMLADSGRIKFFDRAGHVRGDAAGVSARYSARGDEGYLRVECQTATGSAWSQPLWVGMA